MKPGEDPEIIDAEYLDKAREEGLITDKLYKKALDEANKLIGMLKSIYAG